MIKVHGIMRLLVVICVVSSLLVTSCASSVRCGDVRFVHTPAFPLAVADAVVFPKIPIGQRGVFTYHVNNLPRCIYPESFTLKIPDAEADRGRHDQPWRNAIIRASIIADDGKILSEHTINFASDWNGNFDDTNHRLAFFLRSQSSRLPARASYSFRVSVLKPSARATDQLEIEAFALD